MPEQKLTVELVEILCLGAFFIGMLYGWMIDWILACNRKRKEHPND